MSKIKLTLPAGETVTYGKLITFTAPCACTSVDGIQVAGTNYTLADALGNSLGAKNAFASGALVTVALDTTNKKALLQNSGIVAAANTISETLPIAKGGTGKTTASEALAALGGAPFKHQHTASDITDGALPIVYGGTGAATLSDAQRVLGIPSYESLDYQCNTIQDYIHPTAPPSPGLYCIYIVEELGSYREVYPLGLHTINMQDVNAISIHIDPVRKLYMTKSDGIVVMKRDEMGSYTSAPGTFQLYMAKL